MRIMQASPFAERGCVSSVVRFSELKKGIIGSGIRKVGQHAAAIQAGLLLNFLVEPWAKRQIVG